MASLSELRARTAHRDLWADGLRVFVIAAVIVVHTATGYVTDLAGWYYDDERVSSGAWSALLVGPMLFGAVFGLGPLFVVAGWFAARSIARHGPAGFAASRLVRLGVPLLLFVVVVNPLTDYVGNLRDEKRSFGYYLSTTELSVLWFVAALLVFSLAYAAWYPFRKETGTARPLRSGLLVVSALTIALTSFAVWLVWPLNEDVWLNLRIPAWPQGAVLFALGVHAARAGGLDELPRPTVRRLGRVLVASLIVLALLLAIEGPKGDDALAMAADWPTMAFALLDGVIAVSFSLWVIAWLRRRWTRQGPLLDKAGRASYATYVIHPLVLTTVMLLFAPVPLPPEIKFVLVAAAAIPACFTAGYALTRLPGISRVL